MWCKVCQQDVPGIASLSDGKIQCARCTGNLEGGASVLGARARETADAGLDLGSTRRRPTASAVRERAIEQDEDLRRLKRLTKLAAGAPKRTGERPAHRFDPPETEALHVHMPLGAGPGIRTGQNSAPAPSAYAPVRRAPLVAWITLALGLMAFASGLVLLVCAVVSEHSELWTLGLPVTLAGQCGLVVGLVLLSLDRLWQSSAENNSRLQDVDARLLDLRQATSVLGTTQAGPSASFYTHMAHGASPQLLLADLKSQLDLLAVRMSQR